VHRPYRLTCSSLAPNISTLTHFVEPLNLGRSRRGPKTECYPHRDRENFAPSQCSVGSLGDYGTGKGGHLAFWDLGLVVRFPPGSVFPLPPALVWHSNTPVAPHKHRYSFAQYTSGGLFRWAWNGFELGPEKLAESDGVQRKQWMDGAALFSRLPEL
jgi:hypothetical protein